MQELKMSSIQMLLLLLLPFLPGILCSCFNPFSYQIVALKKNYSEQCLLTPSYIHERAQQNQDFYFFKFKFVFCQCNVSFCFFPSLFWMETVYDDGKIIRRMTFSIHSFV